MSDGPSLSLLVIRVSDIARSAQFYSALRITFQREHHPRGPEHYAAALGEMVFEIYPASERYPVTNTRLGFTVDAIDSVLNKWRSAGTEILSEPTESPWGLRAVVADPDGHRVELLEKPQQNSPTRELLEVYSQDTNYAIIKPPGRQFPGAVIQGDSLSILCSSARRIAEAVRDNKTDDEEFPSEVEDLLHSLLGRLHHYEKTLQRHGIALPYSRPVSKADFIKLTPDDDDA